MIRDKYLFYLLHIIRYNGSVDTLINFGLEYSQITNYLLQAIDDGLVENKEGVLELSNLGKERFLHLDKKLNPNNSNRYLLPQDTNKITKIDKFEIYLPDKTKLGF